MKTLKNYCEIIIPPPLTRLLPKHGSEGDRSVVKTISPKAISDGLFDDDGLWLSEVELNDSKFLTYENDIIVKVTTPYSCVLVDEGHTGLLTTSAMAVLRKKEDVEIEMAYVAAFLNSTQVRAKFKEVSTGTSTKTLSKRILSELELPNLGADKENKIAEVYLKYVEVKKACYCFQNMLEATVQAELGKQFAKQEVD